MSGAGEAGGVTDDCCCAQTQCETLALFNVTVQPTMHQTLFDSQICLRLVSLNW